MAKDETREMELVELMEKIGTAKTAAGGRDLSKNLRTLAERYRRDAERLEEDERLAREERTKAMQSDFLTTFGSFVLDAVSTDAAALSLFESYGDTLRAHANQARTRIAALGEAGDAARAAALSVAQADLERFSDLLAIHDARKP